MADIAALGLRVDGTEGVERASRALDGLSESGRKSEGATSRLAQAFKSMTSVQRQMLDAINRIDTQLGSIAAGMSRTATSADSASSSVSVLSGGTEALADAAVRATDLIGLEAGSIDALADATNKASTATDEMVDAAQKASQELESHRNAYDNIRASLDPVFAATRKYDRSVISLNEALAKGAISGKEHADVMRMVGREHERATGYASRFANALTSAKGLVAAVGSALAIRQTQQLADSWSDMQSVVGAAIQDMSQAGDMMTRLVDIANASYSPLQQTVDVYARNVTVLREMGRSADEAADFTESLNNMLVLTATRGQRAESVQNALSKAMAVGRLQADGLETVLANGGEVAAALAGELGTNVNGLRAFASEGKITGQVIASAIIGSLDDVRARAEEMPATLSDAFTRVGNNFTELVGRIDKASGTTSAMAEAVLSLADGIRTAGDYIIAFGQYAAPVFDVAKAGLTTVAQYADIALVALAGFYAPAMIGGIAMLTTSLAVGLVGAIKAVTAAMLANPVGLIVGALAAAAYMVYRFRDSIEEAIGVDVVATFKSAANFMIGSVMASYETWKFVFTNLPNAIAGGLVGAANLVIRTFNRMAQNAIEQINFVIKLANNLPNVKIDTIEWAGLAELENKYASDLAEAGSELAKTITDAFSKDYVAGLSKAAGEAAGAIRQAMSQMSGGSSVLTEDQKELQKSFEQTLSQYHRQINLSGDATEAEKLLYEMQYGRLKGLEGPQAQLLKGMADQIDLAQKLRDINAERDTIAAALMTEEEKIRESYRRRREIVMAAEFENEAARSALLLRLQSETDQKLLEASGTYWQRWLLGAQESLTNFNDLSSSVVENFQTRFGDAVESMVFDSEKFSDAMKGMAESMLRSVVNALGQMAAQWLAYQIVQLMVEKTTQSTGAVAMIANAQATSAQAALAAYASTAAIPIVGPPAAPAAAAAATAATSPMVAAVSSAALAGIAHNGLDYVPREGTWLLDRGERVVDARTNADLKRYLNSGRDGNSGNGGTNVVVNLVENQSRAGEVDRTDGPDGSVSITAFVADIRRDGPASKAMSQAFGLKRRGK